MIVPTGVLLTVSGDHKPVFPSADVTGKIGAVVPTQKEAIGSKVTGIGVVTVVVSVAVVKQPAVVAVNVYVAPVVLSMVVGNQVPEIGVAFVDGFGNVGAVVPAQKDAIGLKVGVMLGLIVTVSVVEFAH